jgi:hypothetical protein
MSQISTTGQPRTSRRPQPESYTSPGLDLPTAARVFVRYPSLKLLAPLLAAAVLTRVLLAGWTYSDLIVAGVILALEPFTEWITHTTLLHWKPRRLGRLRLDPLAARKHRAHHRDPKRIDLVLIPFPVLVTSVVVGAGIFVVAAPSIRLAVTGMLTSYAMLLAYEWTHFLIHSSYRPRRWYYRYIWRAHRLHHFRNERYWFGVTVHLADHVLRTFPDKDAVPPSPTALTLGVEAA